MDENILVDGLFGFSGGPDPNSGCGIVLIIMLLIGGIGMFIEWSCSPSEKPSNVPTPKIEQVEKRESISHFLGRKTKDSVIEFGKGVIGK